MSHPRSSVDGRDDRATDRDDTADRRDDTTRDRDEAAHQRDTEADKRDEQARDSADDLTGHIRQIGRQIVDRLARIENTTLDPADWPDLTPAALARLEARITEQRRLAGLDRAAIGTLLDEIQRALGDRRHDRMGAGNDRRAAEQDRHHSAGDRRDARRDRNDAERDRNQAAIEREQVDPCVIDR